MKACISGVVLAVLGYCVYTFSLWEVAIEHWGYSILAGYLPVGILVGRIVYWIDPPCRVKDSSEAIGFILLWPLFTILGVCILVFEAVGPSVGVICNFVVYGSFTKPTKKEVDNMEVT